MHRTTILFIVTFVAVLLVLAAGSPAASLDAGPFAADESVSAFLLDQPSPTFALPLTSGVSTHDDATALVAHRPQARRAHRAPAPTAGELAAMRGIRVEPAATARPPQRDLAQVPAPLVAVMGLSVAGVFVTRPAR